MRKGLSNEEKNILINHYFLTHTVALIASIIQGNSPFSSRSCFSRISDSCRCWGCSYPSPPHFNLHLLLQSREMLPQLWSKEGFQANRFRKVSKCQHFFFLLLIIKLLLSLFKTSRCCTAFKTFFQAFTCFFEFKPALSLHYSRKKNFTSRPSVDELPKGGQTLLLKHHSVQVLIVKFVFRVVWGYTRSILSKNVTIGLNITNFKPENLTAPQLATSTGGMRTKILFSAIFVLLSAHSAFFPRKKPAVHFSCSKICVCPLPGRNSYAVKGYPISALTRCPGNKSNCQKMLQEFYIPQKWLCIVKGLVTEI